MKLRYRAKLSKRFWVSALAVFSAFAGFSSPASAYTECQGSVTRLWAGDSGTIWIYLDSGGSALIASNDPNREAAISLATTALVSAKQVIIRYNSSGVSCTAVGTNDFAGIFLLR